jgi:hypothetical protein
MTAKTYVTAAGRMTYYSISKLPITQWKDGIPWHRNDQTTDHQQHQPEIAKTPKSIQSRRCHLVIRLKVGVLGNIAGVRRMRLRIRDNRRKLWNLRRRRAMLWCRHRGRDRIGSLENRRNQLGELIFLRRREMRNG